MELLNTNQPTPEQLFAIASLGVLLAKEQTKLKPSRQKPHAHLFVPHQIDTVVASEVSTIEAFHKFAGRVARVDHRQWRLLLVEGFQIIDEGGRNFGTRATYQFEWTHTDTLQATRNIHSTPSNPNDGDLADELDKLGRLDAELELLPLRVSMQEVTMGDCILLAESMREYIDSSREAMAA